MMVQNKISKQMMEHIGMAYVAALEVVPETKILATRRLLTLLSGAVKINGDTQYTKLILDCINDCEKAISEYAESEEQWAHACFLCNKILDKLTPLIYGGYGTVGAMTGFTLQNQGEQKR